MTTPKRWINQIKRLVRRWQLRRWIASRFYAYGCREADNARYFGPEDIDHIIPVYITFRGTPKDAEELVAWREAILRGYYYGELPLSGPCDQ